MKRTFLALFLLMATVSLAQAPAPLPPVMPQAPDILTSQAASSIALKSYKDWNEARLNDLWLASVAHETKISSFTDQSTTIETLRGQVAAQDARIKALEDALAALKAKLSTAGNTLSSP